MTRYALEASATYKKAKRSYWSGGTATKRVHETMQDVEKYTMHRGKAAYHGGPASLAACNGRTYITTGHFSFTAAKDWSPRKQGESLEDLAFLALMGKGVPEWAYRAKPCNKCFVLPVKKVECNMGYTHKMLEEDYERLVGGGTGWSPYREGPDNYGNQSLRFYPEGP